MMSLKSVIQICGILIIWNINCLLAQSSAAVVAADQEVDRYDPVADFGIDFKKIPAIVKQAKQYMGQSNGSGKIRKVKFLGPIVAMPRNPSQKYYKRQIKDYVQHSLLPLRPAPKYRPMYPKYRKYYRPPRKYYRYSRPYLADELGYVDVEPFYEDDNPYLMRYGQANLNYENYGADDLEQMWYGDDKPVDYKVPYYPDVYGEYMSYNKERAEQLKLHEALVNANYFRTPMSAPHVDSSTAYSDNYYSAFPSSAR